jgi:thiol-disulfide isomerase/thioredoxin
MSRRVVIPFICLFAFIVADAATRHVRRASAADRSGSDAVLASSSWLEEPFALSEFRAVDLDGRDVSPGTWRGRVAIVNFWATWCGPCRNEMPDLMALQERYRGRLIVLGVAQDGATTDVLRAFATSLQVNYPIARSSWEVESAFSEVLVLPMTYLVDSAGRVVARYAGQFDPRQLGADVARLLQSARASGAGSILP